MRNQITQFFAGLEYKIYISPDQFFELVIT